MTLHRRRKPYSLAYARRRLREIDEQIAWWQAQPVGSDWRLASDKAPALAKLESLRPRFDRVVHPRVEIDLRMPF